MTTRTPAAAAALLAIATTSACGHPTPAPTPTPRTATITYQGDGGAGTGSITYSTDTGTRQQTGIDLPIVNGNGDPGIVVDLPQGHPVVVVLQNGGDTGTITCRILASDGTVIAENASSGPYGVATCSGIAR